MADVFLSEIGRGPGPERVMELQWRGAHLLTVDRQAPYTNSIGKIRHLHQQQSNARGDAIIARGSN